MVYHNCSQPAWAQQAFYFSIAFARESQQSECAAHACLASELDLRDFKCRSDPCPRPLHKGHCRVQFTGLCPVHMPAIKVAFAKRQAVLAQQGVDHAEVKKEIGQGVLMQKGGAIQRHHGLASGVVDGAFGGSCKVVGLQGVHIGVCCTAWPASGAQALNTKFTAISTCTPSGSMSGARRAASSVASGVPCCALYAEACASSPCSWVR